MLCVVCTAPYALFFMFCCHRIPESPAWLEEKGRTDEADEILRSMAHGNGTELPHNLKLFSGEPTYVVPSSNGNPRVGLGCYKLLFSHISLPMMQRANNLRLVTKYLI